MLTNLGFLPVEIDVTINLAPKPASLMSARTTEPVCYCAIAKMPPARECQSGETLIGQFRSLTAISAMPP